ncbi:MAG TPA: sulfatase [Vicinamibacteria bacterium]|nr:sulfatase [Vicinamibacteria bacterium]
MKRLLAALAGAVAFAAVLRAPAPRLPPNIVLILVDTLRRDHLPFYGYPKDTAPFLASLAPRSAVFENAHSVSAWTPPAAASLFTSLYPFEHGVVRGLALAKRQERLKGVEIRLPRLPSSAETIPEALRRRGYATFAITENPNLTRALGFDQGFDRFDAFPTRLDAEPITARLLERAPELRRRAPYFLYLHYMDVHAPYRERPPLFDPSLEGDARRVSAYDSGIRVVDEHVRRAFEALGWEADTLLLVTADHGEELGDRGHFGHGASLFSELLDVPLLVHGPGVVPRRVPDRVSLIDVLPTLREVAALPSAATDAGVSLAPLLRDPNARLPPRPLFAHLWRRQAKDGRELALRATLEGDWKRIGGEASGTLLFNLREDPGERLNRARDEPARERALQRLYQQHEMRARRYASETVEVGLDAAAIEGLNALGYVN